MYKPKKHNSKPLINIQNESQSDTNFIFIYNNLIIRIRRIAKIGNKCKKLLTCSKSIVHLNPCKHLLRETIFVINNFNVIFYKKVSQKNFSFQNISQSKF